jgi:hypothetical protein
MHTGAALKKAYNTRMVSKIMKGDRNISKTQELKMSGCDI